MSRKIAQQTEAINDDSVDETPIDYFYHNNTTRLLKDALDRLIENRPGNPIEFLAEFFSPVSDDYVDCAYRKLRWCHYSMKAYQQNILEVYSTLMSTVDNDTNIKGLLGEEYNILLNKIASDLPAEYVTNCLQKLRIRNRRVVSFNRFYHDVLLLHVMDDYIKLLHAIYKDLDLNNTGNASNSLCQDVLATITKNREETSLDLLTENIGNVSLNSLDNEKDCMKERDFVTLAVDILLKIV